MRGLFITGTDTGVGKTLVASSVIRAARARGVRVGAYKPVCSGCEQDAAGDIDWPDVSALAEAVGGEVPLERICPQRFAAPLAPTAAAAAEQRTVSEPQLLQGIEDWRSSAELLVIEGVGGLLCPLSQSLTVADFASEVGVPLVIVAALRLGVINHTLLTIEVARRRQLPMAGVLLNQLSDDDGSNPSSIAEITQRAGVPILGIVPTIRDGRLRPPEVITRIDWHALAAPVSRF